MEKLKLDLEVLEIQSFETTGADAVRRGTVRGHDETMENCFTFDQDTCDCSNQYDSQCCEDVPPSVNMMECDSWWYSCRGCGSGGDRVTGDPWNPTCS